MTSKRPIKTLSWTFCNVSLAMLGASALRSQNIDGAGPLKEYVDPPAIRSVNTVFMEDMTWLEIKNAMKAGKTTVIVPAGGLEASGPFLVLDKHQQMLRGSTEMIARKLGNALAAPVIRYVPPDDGNRGNYLGDFNISLAAYKSTLSDICTALRNDGFQEIVLIGDHQGAQRGMKEVAEELTRKWTGSSTAVHYIAEYYDRKAVSEYVKTKLGITEARGHFGVIKDGIAIRRRVGQRLPQLLNNPVGGRMTRDIEVQNPSAAVFDDKEAVKQPKRCRRHGKEVERNGDFSMVLQKRKPLLTRIAAPAQTTQVSRDRSLG